MHWLLFIQKKIFPCTCFEPQVPNFRRIQLYTCSVWYCHCLWEFVVACRYTARVRTDCRGKVVGGCLKTPTNNPSLLQNSIETQRYRTTLIFFERPIVLSRAELGIWTCDSLFHCSEACLPSDGAAAQVGLACIYTPFVHILSCKFLLSRHELPITDDPRGSETTRSISHCCLLSVEISKSRLLR